MRDFQSGFEYLSRSKTFLHSLSHKLTPTARQTFPRATRDAKFQTICKGWDREGGGKALSRSARSSALNVSSAALAFSRT